VTYGFAPEADVGPEALDGIDVKLPGRHNLENALAAVACAEVLGVARDAILRGIASVDGVPGRMERIDAGQPFEVIVDYAHKPDALEQVLRTARDLASGDVIVVFGAGGDRDRGKRPEMGRIAAALADHVVVTSDNPRGEDAVAIIDEILGGCESASNVNVYLDRRDAIEWAIRSAERGDVVVIAGKGHEQGQEIGGRKLPFDDRQVAREALKAVVRA
jgi:UDP-N-acetylmuramoyl-L-alanyl-D-glutamate--2,6-diaminopimelate ligase